MAQQGGYVEVVFEFHPVDQGSQFTGGKIFQRCHGALSQEIRWVQHAEREAAEKGELHAAVQDAEGVGLGLENVAIQRVFLAEVQRRERPGGKEIEVDRRAVSESQGQSRASIKHPTGKAGLQLVLPERALVGGEDVEMPIQRRGHGAGCSGRGGTGTTPVFLCQNDQDFGSKSPRGGAERTLAKMSFP